MAYVLGFFAADGSMSYNKRGAYYIEFEITDKQLLETIRNALGSTHKITERKRSRNRVPSYRLQIGSKTMFYDLLELGLAPRKSKALRLPKISSKYLPHFVRVYFDGDGNVISGYFKSKDRNNPKHILLTRFISGSQSFLEDLQRRLAQAVKIKGSISHHSNAYTLSYSSVASRKLAHWMYRKKDDLIYLERKHKIFQEAGVA
jgi:intein-encoded DNA endonuclease-like protein